MMKENFEGKLLMKDKTEITIVYATDDNYVLFAMVSLCSLLKNSNKDNEYNIYILCDKSLTENSKGLCNRVVNKYENCSLKYICVDDAVFEKVLIQSSYITKATMYRLLLPQLLKEEQCIYLDCDTIILSDISKIVEEKNIENSYLAGVIDKKMCKLSEYTQKIDIQSMDTYINVGVLVMNLKKLRDDKMVEVFLQESERGYLFSDQDILNKVCYGKIEILPSKYNSFSISKKKEEDIVIQHFAGGCDVKPWINSKSRGSAKWWNEAEFFCDTDSYLRIKQQSEAYGKLRQYELMFKKCKESKTIYIWGFTKVGRYLLDSLINQRINKDICFIDNDKSKIGLSYNDVEVYSKEIMKNNSSSIVINTVQNHREEITSYLKQKGWTDEQIVQYYPKTKQYYLSLDDRYLKQEYEEMLLWNYGIEND